MGRNKNMKNNNNQHENNTSSTEWEDVKNDLIMLHLPLSHMWYSSLYHNALLFCYLNRLLQIRPFLHTLPKKSNCYSVSSFHSLNSPLLHPSRNVFNRISDLKLKNKIQFAMNVHFPSTILFFQ